MFFEQPFAELHEAFKSRAIEDQMVPAKSKWPSIGELEYEPDRPAVFRGQRPPPCGASSLNQTVRLPRLRRRGIIVPPIGHPMPLPGNVTASAK